MGTVHDDVERVVGVTADEVRLGESAADECGRVRLIELARKVGGVERDSLEWQLGPRLLWRPGRAITGEPDESARED